MGKGHTTLFATLLVVTVVPGIFEASSPLFVCHGDVCNKHGNDQFCDQKYRICRDCENIQDECDKVNQPQNCSHYCIDLLVETRLKKEREKQCPPLQDVPNGSHNGSGSHDTGDVIGITCSAGYVMVGVYSITCGAYGQWNNELPSCTPESFNWKTLCIGTVVYAVTVSVLLIISTCCWIYDKRKKRKAGKPNINQNTNTNGNKDETMEPLIPDKTGETKQATGQTLTIETETSPKLKADPLPPRTTNEIEGEHGELDDTYVKPPKEHNEQRIPSSASFDQSIDETDEEGGNCSSDSGVKVVRDKKGGIHITNTINITNNQGDKTSKDENNCAHRCKPSENKRKTSKASNKLGTKANESEVNTTPPTQESGVTKDAIQAEQSSDEDDDVEKSCIKCLQARTTLQAESATERDSISNVHCNPDATADKVQVAIGANNIPLDDIH